MFAKPLAQSTQANDVIAMIFHQRRHRPVRQSHIAGWTQYKKAVLGNGRINRRAFGFPVRHQAIEANGVNDGAREDVRANLRALLNHNNGNFFASFGGYLLQADRG